MPDENGLALVDEGAHRLPMIRRSRGADHVCRFLVHRIHKVGRQGMVKVVLHAGESMQGALGQRPCKRKCNIAKLGVGYHPIDKPRVSQRRASIRSDRNINSRARDVPTSRVSSQATP